ncbi:hypothetical protein GH714_013742 [Hevea brasiliensis]|uniref:tRNA/rRNA methyltransferase SpoU type domain-containing protein n=1 Tax=Hevea brasiliensis TaxID=3981 RepID=A0A6A6KFM6_HEVBR|nr:hypothetical protein GH714_013742 [Hevea brasiliensis]
MAISVWTSFHINNYFPSAPPSPGSHICSSKLLANDMRVQVDDEDMATMNLIRSDDWVVMLDERGLDIVSEQMAEGASRLSFCIGGPYGHGQRMRKRANISIRLSSMVLNHQIALVVLVEQLYR